MPPVHAEPRPAFEAIAGILLRVRNMRPFQAILVLGGLALRIVGLSQNRALAIAGLGMIVLAVLGNLVERR